MTTAQSFSASRARLISAAEKRKRSGKTAGDEYYGSHDQLEEIIEANSDAILTRNHYGCVVLNAARTLFIDVDVLDSGKIGHNEANDRCENATWQRVLDDLCVVLENSKNEGFRIYRTAAGYRILATTHEFEPGSLPSSRLMRAAGADAAFVRLCRIQKSFRARLSPKPWRCGTRRPPNLFPRHTAEEQRHFYDWLARYELACRDHATCQYIGHVGAAPTHEHIAPVIELHDRETKSLQPLPLA